MVSGPPILEAGLAPHTMSGDVVRASRQAKWHTEFKRSPATLSPSQGACAFGHRGLPVWLEDSKQSRASSRTDACRTLLPVLAVRLQRTLHTPTKLGHGRLGAWIEVPRQAIERLRYQVELVRRKQHGNRRQRNPGPTTRRLHLTEKGHLRRPQAMPDLRRSYLERLGSTRWTIRSRTPWTICATGT